MKLPKQLKQVLSITLMCLLVIGVSPFAANSIFADEIYSNPEVPQVAVKQPFFSEIPDGYAAPVIEPVVPASHEPVPVDDPEQPVAEMDDPSIPTFASDNFSYPTENGLIPKSLQLTPSPEQALIDPATIVSAHWEVQLADGSWQLIDENIADLPFLPEQTYRVHVSLPAAAVLNQTPPAEIKLNRLPLLFNPEFNEPDQLNPPEDKVLTPELSVNEDAVDDQETPAAPERFLHYLSIPLHIGDQEIIDVSEEMVGVPVGGSNAIYLDGVRGNDDNDGFTAETAVLTFDQAKSLANQHGCSTIYVTGMVTLSGNVTLEAPGLTILRDPGFKGYLFHIPTGVDVTLRQITIDGNRDQVAAENSLIYSAGTLHIEEGAILQNNKTVAKSWTYGGAIFAASGTVQITGGILQNNFANYGGAICAVKTALELQGGTIQNNECDPDYGSFGGGIYGEKSSLNMTGGSVNGNQSTTHGGGIFLNKCTMNLSGGDISRNKTTSTLDDQGDYPDEGGGGIYCLSSTLNMSGGSLSENGTAGDGGGVSCVNSDSKLNLTGGSISHNTASDNGGGISLQHGQDHQIVSGLITGNSAGGIFGGGGMYVDSGTKLYMSRTLITDNSINTTLPIDMNGYPYSQQGGGLWNCYLGSTTIYISNGLAIFENRAPDREPADGELHLGCGDDAAIVSRNYNQSIKLASRMLGGGFRLWYQDGSYYQEGTNLHGNQSPRCNPDNPGEPMPYDTKIQDREGHNLAYKSLPTQAARDLARQVASVVVSGNTVTGTGSTGGGIANNGHITFGDDTPYRILIKKDWAGDTSKLPDQITLGMYVGDHYIQDVVLEKANQWKAVVEDFPDPATLTDAATGERLPITFREAALIDPAGNPYVLSVESETRDETSSTYTIHLKNTPDAMVHISVEKVWEDPQDATRPNEVMVSLLQNGQIYRQQSLSESNQWHYTFRDLPKTDDDGNAFHYSVEEVPVSGYSSHITGNAGDGFTITNSRTPQPSESEESLHIAVRKVWDDDRNSSGKRPSSVTIWLFENGEKTDRSLVLSEANGWQGVFYGLDKDLAVYSVEEVNVDSHYAVTKSGNAAMGYTFTNTYQPEETTPSTAPSKPSEPTRPLLPRTGEGDSLHMLLEVALLGAAGFLFIVRKSMHS